MANYLFAFQLLFLFSDLIIEVPRTLGKSCDEDTFYEPYIIVKKKKNGGDLASIRETGFMDLRFRNRVLLCMNGPVVLYADVERLDPEARLQPDNDKSRDTLQAAPDARYPSPDHGISTEGLGEEELRFRKGELMVFSHQCISINKIPTNFLKKMKEEQAKGQPEIMPDTQVIGRLVLGAFLIGDKEGFIKPELAWFKGTNYDYIKTRDKTVKDSSFIQVNTQTSHCLRLPDGTHVKIGGPYNNNGTIEVCRWTPKEEDKHWYAKIFQRGYDANGIRNGEDTLEEHDYEFYECPDGDPDRNIILTMSKTTPEPVSHTNYTEFDPFSLFNPNMWTPHGLRRDSNGLSGGDERAEDKAMSTGVSPDGDAPCSSDPSNPGCGEEMDMDMTTLRDMQNVEAINSNTYEIETAECIELPMFDSTKCECAADNGDRLMELVLELETQEPKPDNDTVTPGPPSSEGEWRVVADEDRKKLPYWGNLDDVGPLKWKLDILYLVSEIFSHLCMPFRADFPYSVARVMGWYVLKAHAYGPEMGRPPPGEEMKKGAMGVKKDDKKGAGPAAAGTRRRRKRADEQAEYPEPLGDFDKWVNRTDTWVILQKELERCSTVAKNENGGKGLKFQWEVGEETGKWKIPAQDGSTSRRRRRRKRSLETPIWHKNTLQMSKSRDNPFYEEDRTMSGEGHHRSKRSYNSSIPQISKKYILPGKTMTVVKSEGTVGYAREAIQEFKPKPDLNDPRADSAKYSEDFPENIQHCWHPQEDPVNRQIVCSKAEDIFFYEDRAEIEYELNIAIDLWWKIWATAIGYCNKAYHSRKSETFPRLYNSMYEYFFDLVQKEWKHPCDNEDLKIIFSEYLCEESHVWLDACLEASYINSNSHSYRPPRPLSITEKEKEVSNYFEEIPTYLYYRYHPEPAVQI